MDSRRPTEEGHSPATHTLKYGSGLYQWLDSIKMALSRAHQSHAPKCWMDPHMPATWVPQRTWGQEGNCDNKRAAVGWHRHFWFDSWMGFPSTSGQWPVHTRKGSSKSCDGVIFALMEHTDKNTAVTRKCNRRSHGNASNYMRQQNSNIQGIQQPASLLYLAINRVRHGRFKHIHTFLLPICLAPSQW